MKLYLIQNKVTKQWAEALATSAQEACIKVGWLIGDCYIKEIK